MSSSARPSSRDAELEALRANSIVGRQRSQLNSAPLPNMTMDSWYEQQRNLSKEEQRKKMEAASQLHNYRGKEIPVTKKREPLISPKFAVLADGASLPPGPDAPQEDVRGKDVRGIVTCLETTKKLPSLGHDDNDLDVMSGDAKKNGDLCARDVSKIGVIDGESTISVAEEIKKYSKSSSKETENFNSEELIQPVHIQEEKEAPSEAAFDSSSDSIKESEMASVDGEQMAVNDMICGEPIIQNTVNDDKAETLELDLAAEPTKIEKENSNKENTNVQNENADISNAELAVSENISTKDDKEVEEVFPAIEGADNTILEETESIHSPSPPSQNNEDPLAINMSSESMTDGPSSLPVPKVEETDKETTIEKPSIDEQNDSSALLAVEECMGKDANNEKGSALLEPHVPEENNNLHEGATIVTTVPPDEVETKDKEEIAEDINPTNENIGRESATQKVENDTSQGIDVSPATDSKDPTELQQSNVNDASTTESLPLAEAALPPMENEADPSNEKKFDTKELSNSVEKTEAKEAPQKVSYAQVVGNKANCFEKTFNESKNVAVVPAVAENFEPNVPPQQDGGASAEVQSAAVATSPEHTSLDSETLKKIDVKVLLAVHVKQSDGDAVVQGRGKSILESVVGVTERIVKETLETHREKELPESFNKEAFRLAVYKDDHRPYVETVNIDPDFKNAPKGIVRLVVREVVCIFEPKSISKKDAGQVIGVVADALRNSVANGRFAKEAKALRKIMKQKAKQ